MSDVIQQPTRDLDDELTIDKFKFVTHPKSNASEKMRAEKSIETPSAVRAASSVSMMAIVRSGAHTCFCYAWVGLLCVILSVCLYGCVCLSVYLSVVSPGMGVHPYACSHCS